MNKEEDICWRTRHLCTHVTLMFLGYCWQALARQHPILYNSEKKAVGCKIEDMRSRLCFFISGHSGVLVNARGNIDRFQAIVQLS